MININVVLINALLTRLMKREFAMENRTARLTLLIDPKKKSAFEQLCAREDVTPSQKVRQFIREYIEIHLGPEWKDQVFGTDENN